jgi:hypothetical protein
MLATTDNGGEVEFSGIHAGKRKEVPSPTDATPARAKGTASVELAGKAEKATAAKPEALEPGPIVTKDAGTSATVRQRERVAIRKPERGQCRVGRKALRRAGAIGGTVRESTQPRLAAL